MGGGINIVTNWIKTLKNKQQQKRIPLLDWQPSEIITATVHDYNLKVSFSFLFPDTFP